MKDAPAQQPKTQRSSMHKDAHTLVTQDTLLFKLHCCDG